MGVAVSMHFDKNGSKKTGTTFALSICNAGASRNPKTRFAKVTPTDDIKNQKIYEYRKIFLDMS